MDPGWVAVHRLNRAEYDATVRDLLGTTLRPSDSFPADDSAEGWDNLAGTLSLSPLHLELYEHAAQAVLVDVLGQRAPEPVDWQWPDAGQLTWSAPYEGRYDLTVTPRVAELPLVVRVDGSTYATLHDADPHQFSLRLDPGPHQIEIDAELAVRGPYEVEWPRPASRSRVLACEPPSGQPDACARETLEAFVPRAWRRPVSTDEIDGLMGLYDLTLDAGGDWDEGIRNALLATLLSPHFLFRIEIDRSPHSDEVRPLNGYELASRLSYFLWSSMPDAQLFALAASGDLLEDEVLASQVRRMLEDDRASALVDNFAGQWLMIRAVDDVFPDYAVYPDWDEQLHASMREEMRLYAEEVLLSDRSMRDLLTSKESFVDTRLAVHYGMQPIPAELGHVRVDATDYARAGIVTTAGLLTVLSYPTRTSPVKRGKWVMSNLLCETPPPPPPEVEGLPQAAEGEVTSLREQMEAHRADPVCASCHQVMDPIGFSFEHYDGVGAYRDEDALGFPIDATGQLPDGTGFQDVHDLMRPLSFSPKFSQCVAQKTLTYALGRTLTVEDVAALQQVTEQFEARDLRFADLVQAIVLSEPFRYRRGETP